MSSSRCGAPLRRSFWPELARGVYDASGLRVQRADTGRLLVAAYIAAEITAAPDAPDSRKPSCRGDVSRRVVVDEHEVAAQPWSDVASVVEAEARSRNRRRSRERGAGDMPAATSSSSSRCMLAPCSVPGLGASVPANT